jgi:hypothetical protein
MHAVSVNESALAGCCLADELAAARAQVSSVTELAAAAEQLRGELAGELEATRAQLAGLDAKVEENAAVRGVKQHVHAAR